MGSRGIKSGVGRIGGMMGRNMLESVLGNVGGGLSFFFGVW